MRKRRPRLNVDRSFPWIDIRRIDRLPPSNGDGGLFGLTVIIVIAIIIALLA